MEEIKTIIDNTKDWYNLADTALKIGLGALIAGFFTYINNKSNHSQENKKLKFELKKNILIEINELSSRYFYLLIQLTDIMDNNLDNDFVSEIEKIKNLHHSMKELKSKIDFNLNLLSLDSSRKFLHDYEQERIHFFKLLNDGKIDNSKLKNIVERLILHKENFYSELKKFFDNI